MAQIPLYEVGRDTSLLTLYKQNVASDGTLSNDTAFGIVSLYATVEEVTDDTTNRMVNLSPMTRRQRNMVPVESGTRMQFRGLVVRSSGGNAARKVAFGGDYVVANWTEGIAAWTFTGVVESYNQVTNREGSRYTLVLEHIDDLTVSGNVVNNPIITGTI